MTSMDKNNNKILLKEQLFCIFQVPKVSIEIGSFIESLGEKI